LCFGARLISVHSRSSGVNLWKQAAPKPGEMIVGGLVAIAVWQNGHSKSVKIILNCIFMG
jgi:hypothetical protein